MRNEWSEDDGNRGERKTSFIDLEKAYDESPKRRNREVCVQCIRMCPKNT